MVFGFVAVYQLRQNFVIVLLVLGAVSGLRSKNAPKSRRAARQSRSVRIGLRVFMVIPYYVKHLQGVGG